MTQKDLICCIAGGKFLNDDDEIQNYQEPYIFLTSNSVTQHQEHIDQIITQYREKEDKYELLQTKYQQVQSDNRNFDLQISQLRDSISGLQSSSYSHQYSQFQQDNPISSKDNQEMEIEIKKQKEEIDYLNQKIEDLNKYVNKYKQQYMEEHLEYIKLQQGLELEKFGNNNDQNNVKTKEEQIKQLQQQINSQAKLILEHKEEIFQIKAQDLANIAVPNQNHLIEQYRNENTTLRIKIQEINFSNENLQRDIQRVKNDLEFELNLKKSYTNQTSNNYADKELQNQLEIQRNENGNLRQIIGQHKKKEFDFQKEQGIKDQSFQNLQQLSNQKENKIKLQEIQLKASQEELEYQNNEYQTLFTKMKEQETKFQKTVENVKQETSDIINSVEKDKEENLNLISQLNQIIQIQQTSIESLKTKLNNQNIQGKKQEAELTKKEIANKEIEKNKLNELKEKQQDQLKIKDNNIQKIKQINNLEIVQLADVEYKRFLREQEERKRIKQEKADYNNKIEAEQNNQKMLDLNMKKQQQLAAELRNKEGKNLQARLLAKLSKESHGIIEVCFLVDSTGSMEKYIEQTRQCVNGTMTSIKKLTNRNCKWACVAYQDFDELKALKGKYRQIDFTEDPKKLTDFMSPAKLHCNGGGDCAEDIKGGMEQAFKLSWKKPFRIIILITDAPSHGRKYYTKCVDEYPDVILDDTLLKFKQTNTFLIGLQLNKTTGYMFQVFNDFFKSNEAEEFFMTEDLTKIKTEQLWTNIIALISTAAEKATQTNQTGTKTKDKQLNAKVKNGGAMEALCKTLSDPTNFDKQPGIDVTPCKFNIYNVSLRKENFELKKDRVWEIDVDRDFLEQKEPNSWDCVRTANIFAEGQMKAVYLMKKNTSTSEVYVIKQPLGGMTYKTLKAAKMECRSHMISKAFLSSFIDDLRQAKEEKGSFLVIPNVEYSNFIILSDRPDSFWIAERFYNGEFVKYNNNYGWLSDESNDQNQLAQAFSYYTYYNSNFTAIVNDIQGVGQFWTDPALNTDKGNLDDTDMGKDGISMFLVTYQQKINLGKKYLSLLDISIQPS